MALMLLLLLLMHERRHGPEVRRHKWLIPTVQIELFYTMMTAHDIVDYDVAGADDDAVHVHRHRHY